jgi:hypothetical protein
MSVLVYYAPSGPAHHKAVHFVTQAAEAVKKLIQTEDRSAMMLHSYSVKELTVRAMTRPWHYLQGRTSYFVL